MASLSEKLNSLWQNIKASSATIPLKAEIPDDHISYELQFLAAMLSE